MSAISNSLPKAPTGIDGFDEITSGGLPAGRPTLVCGSAGCGKTLFAMEFLIHGAMEYKEPGVFLAFEETAEDLAQNVASLGFDINDLIAKKRLAVDHVHIERSEIQAYAERAGDARIPGQCAVGGACRRAPKEFRPPGTEARRANRDARKSGGN